jgi:hypothetical protein
MIFSIFVTFTCTKQQLSICITFLDTALSEVDQIKVDKLNKELFILAF